MEMVFPNGVSQLECVIRIVLGVFFGAMIGFERSRRQKEAGIRTHIIVALGATLMMIVSKYGFFDMLPFPSTNFTGDRVAANIITGVGFLGAGMIFFRGNSIKGLTTAAGIWATAGVGLAVGAGLYILATVSTLLMIIVQILLHVWQVSADTWVFGEVVVVSENKPEIVERTKKVLEEEGVHIFGNKFKRLETGLVKFTYQVRAGEEVDAVQTLRIAEKLPELVQIEVHGDK